jgi:hypothetical protein
MKFKLLAVLLAFPALALADPNTLNRSSFTATNDLACIVATHLDKVVVGVATAGGSLVIYNSTTTTAALLTTNVLVSSMSLASVTTADFNNTQVKGICYRSGTPTNGVTILYKK